VRSFTVRLAEFCIKGNSNIYVNITHERSERDRMSKACDVMEVVGIVDLDQEDILGQRDTADEPARVQGVCAHAIATVVLST
jgi:hypothetical protein